MANEKNQKAGTASVSISVDMLQEQANEIKEIDTKIAAASGSDATLRKAVVDEILTAHKDEVEGIYTQVIEQFKTITPDVLVGLVARLEDGMKAELKAMTDTVVDEKVKANAGETVDVNGLKETRKAKLDAFRALKTILKSLGQPVDDIEEPKRAGGGRPSGSGSSDGKSGRNKEGYRYTMDGKDRPDSQNSFSSLAYYATNGLDESGAKVPEGTKSKMSSKGLRSYIEAQGIKLGEVDSWELELANGIKIGARKEADAPETTDAPEATANASDAPESVESVPAAV